jgi:hypothetical protein
MLSETRHCDCVIAFSCCMVGSICVADSPASPASHAAKWSAARQHAILPVRLALQPPSIGNGRTERAFWP